MVSLAPYLIADSIDSYKADEIDGQSVEAIFDPAELETRLAYRRSIAADLRALLQEWTRGFVPLNTIERSLSELIDARATGTVERVAGEINAEQAIEMLEPGDTLVDATGARSLLRDLLLPGDEPVMRDRNTLRYRLEYALVVTFLYRPALRLQRMVQVLQESREHRLQVHPGRPPHVLRRIRQPRDRNRQHHPRRVRRNASVVRRRLAARPVSGRRAVDRPVHRQGQGGDARQGRRRLRDRADPAGRLRRTQRDQPPMAGVRPRPPTDAAPGLPARGRGARVALLPIRLAGRGVRVLPGRAHRQPESVDRGDPGAV